MIRRNFRMYRSPDSSILFAWHFKLFMVLFAPHQCVFIFVETPKIMFLLRNTYFSEYTRKQKFTKSALSSQRSTVLKRTQRILNLWRLKKQAIQVSILLTRASMVFGAGDMALICFICELFEKNRPNVSCKHSVVCFLYQFCKSFIVDIVPNFKNQTRVQSLNIEGIFCPLY